MDIFFIIMKIIELYAKQYTLDKASTSRYISIKFLGSIAQFLSLTINLVDDTIILERNETIFSIFYDFLLATILAIKFYFSIEHFFFFSL